MSSLSTYTDIKETAQTTLAEIKSTFNLGGMVELETREKRMCEHEHRLR